MSSDTNAKDTGISLEITTSPSEEQPCSLTNIIPPSCQVCGRLLNDQGSTQQLGPECAELSATVLQVMVTEKHWTLEQIANLYGSTPENVMQKLHELGMYIEEQQNIRTKPAAHTRKNASGGIHRIKRNKTTYSPKDFNKSPTSHSFVRNITKRKGTTKTNTLALRYPELAKEWHPTKNDRTPDQVTTGSTYIAWWQCSVNSKHEWQATVASRVRGRGCSYCAGRKTDGANSLFALRPDLAKEWHPTKNDRTPDQVTIGSKYKAWWQCSVNSKHEWQAKVQDRTRGYGCSYCAGRKVDETNSLLTLRPDLAKEWHPTKNDRTPDQVTIGSHYMAWWQCSMRPKYEWQAKVQDRTRGHGCSYCVGRKVNGTNTLLALRPDLAKEWHPTRNGTLTPDQVTIGSNKEVWWQCLVNRKHEWQAKVNNRVHGTGCSLCTGQKVDETNSLLTLRPDLAKEWHPTKNDRTPEQVTIGSHYMAWWQCLVNSKHEWPATVKDRTYGTGCPKCNNINANEKWYPWEQFCGKLGKILYPSTFRIQPDTRLPNYKLPDFSYLNEHNEVIIADAKTNCWISNIEDSISNYLTYCTQLEFWCLEKKREPIIRDGKIILFLTPEELLTRVLDKQLQYELQKEVQKILEDEHSSMKSLKTFI